MIGVVSGTDGVGDVVDVVVGGDGVVGDGNVFVRGVGGVVSGVISGVVSGSDVAATAAVAVVDAAVALVHNHPNYKPNREPCSRWQQQ